MVTEFIRVITVVVLLRTLKEIAIDDDDDRVAVGVGTRI